MNNHDVVIVNSLVRVSEMTSSTQEELIFYVQCTVPVPGGTNKVLLVDLVLVQVFEGTVLLLLQSGGGEKIIANTS